MSYKIVQSVVDGKASLSVVPNRFDVSGTLHCPERHLATKKSLQEEHVLCGKSEKLNGIKIIGLGTLAEANVELEKMETKSNTQNQKQIFQPTHSERLCCQCNNQDSIYVVEQDSDDSVEIQNLSSLTKNATQQIVGDPVLEQTQQIIVNDNRGVSPQIIYVDEVTTSSSLDSNHLTTIFANQMKILANQDRIIQTQAKLLMYSEHVLQSVTASPFEQHTLNVTSISESFDPVSTLEELDRLESDLKDANIMEKYIRNMHFICGSTGKANGLDCCYKLVDYFITRQFLLQCSWTGSTRVSGKSKVEPNQSLGGIKHQDTGKVGLKFYKKFRTLFLKLIMLADKDFSEIDCDNFFKRIMRNSKQRVVAKTSTSKHRNRPKQLNYKKKKSESSLNNAVLAEGQR